MTMRTVNGIFFIVVVCIFAGCTKPEIAYERLITKSRADFESGQYKLSRESADKAIKVLPARIEAYMLAASSAELLNENEASRAYLGRALEYATDEQKSRLKFILKKNMLHLGKTEDLDLRGRDALEYMRGLCLALAARLDDRTRANVLQALYSSSLDFTNKYPNNETGWLILARSAIELERPHDAWRASMGLRMLKSEQSSEPQFRSVMDLLQKKGWADETPPTVVNGTMPNSLGMRFVKIPNEDAAICIWETRSCDFDAFAQSAGYDSSQNVYAGDHLGIYRPDYRDLDWYSHYDTTKGRLYPKYGASASDADAFCRWLTVKDRNEGRIGADDYYRLPTEREWLLCLGSKKTEDGESRFPWGNQWPPPPLSGNYGDFCFSTKYQTAFIKNYYDNAVIISPVGSYKSNDLGIYDMSGNISELCIVDGAKDENPTKSKPHIVVMGGDWNSASEDELKRDAAFAVPYEYRSKRIGFRVVLDASKKSNNFASVGP